jgi:tetratricopeptide (TPR) repeat protein
LNRELKILIAFSTAWGAKFGGINSFNFDFLQAFAGVSFRFAKTFCVVLSATPQEIEMAAGEQVILVPLNLPSDKPFLIEYEAIAWSKIEEVIGQVNVEHITWLGHDRITGSIAVAAAEMRGGKSVVIHHMSYGNYEAFAENSASGKAKEEEQQNLFRRTDIALAIGPLLRDSLSDLLNTEFVQMLVPGLPDITAKKPPRTFKAFVSGRLGSDAKKIKQAHLGIAAFADAIRQADENPALPDTLKGENEPKLVLRGVDFEENSGVYNYEAELELKLFAEKYANRAFLLHALPFTCERQKLFDELASSTVAMMPSWHEGFGLVAWEAIGAGVPLIVSRKSGVFRLLNEVDDGIGASLVIGVDVAGTSEEPYFRETDKSALAQAIIQVAKNPESYKQKASRLRQSLTEKFTWANCARQFLQAIGWQESEPEVKMEGDVVPLPAPIPVQNLQLSSSAIELLELPSSHWQPNIGLSESQLLRAEEAIIPFDPQRDPFLLEQMAWAKTTGIPIAVRLLTGAGGVGKTRLALEICKRLQKESWKSGFLRGDCDSAQARDLAKHMAATSDKYLMVLDYAETRQTVLLELLAALRESASTSVVRILLLARDGGEWWNLLPSKNAKCESLLSGFASTGPFELPKLHPQEFERRNAYQLALRTFASRLEVPCPDHFPQLGEAHFAHPLYIQMAALIALRGERPKSAEALTRTLVGHERRYWRKALAAIDSSSEIVEYQGALLMALATLANGIATPREIEKVWEKAGGEARLLKPMFKTLAPLYPGRQGLQGWKPDLLGEALIGQVLFGTDGHALLDAVLGQSERWLRRNSLTVLARTLRNRTDIAPVIEDALVENFVRCIDDVVGVCIDTPSTLPTIAEKAFSRLPKSTRWQAAGILERHVKYDILPLAGLDVLISAVIVEKMGKLKNSDSVKSRVERANAMNNLSIALDRNGQDDAALDVVRETLEIREKLAQLDPKTHEAALARSLNTYTNLLMSRGQIDLALQVSKKSLEIRRRLATAKPDEFEGELAMSLNNYAACLSRHGKFEESAKASEEAVKISERLAEKKPGENNDYYALYLSNYAAMLSDQGKDDEALIAAEQAVKIYRSLANSRPERFEHDLARALGNFGNFLSKQGSIDEALVANEKALEINKRLAAANPRRFEPAFADSLKNHAFHLMIQGRVVAAKRMAEEALSLQMKLAEAVPERFESELGSAFNNYSLCLIENGLIDEGLEAVEKAILIREKIAKVRPERYEAELASSLHNKAWQFAGAGRWGEAMVLEEKAVTLNQKCSDRVPDKFIYSYEVGKMATALWSWLSTDITPKVELASDARLVARHRFALGFQYATLLAFFIGSPDSINTSLEYWRQLNKEQQFYWREYYLTVAVLAVCVCPWEAPLNWQGDLEQYLQQRNGHLPRWMKKVIEQRGYKWPADANTQMSAILS